MLRPAVSQILTKNESSYSFVVAVAKRARDLSEIATADRILLEEKPVKTALEEFAAGKFKIREDVSLRESSLNDC